MPCGATNTTNMSEVGLIHKELSYKLNGLFFAVQNKIGTKFQEKHYVKAVCLLLDEVKIPFQVEVPLQVNFRIRPLQVWRIVN